MVAGTTWNRDEPDIGPTPLTKFSKVLVDGTQEQLRIRSRECLYSSIQ